MIPTNVPYTATFRTTRPVRDGGTREVWKDRPVIAWDEDGYALVVGNHGLVRAANLDGYEGLSEGSDSRVVGAIPADGWRIAWKLDDGQEPTDRILLWLVKADGMVEPVWVDPDGDAEGVSIPFNETRFRLVPPAAADPEAKP